VKFSDVKTLVLSKNVMTTGRRLPAMQQVTLKHVSHRSTITDHQILIFFSKLKCLGGTAGCSYSPTSVICFNQGDNGIDISVMLATLIIYEIVDSSH
jgi:hypothetical protein